MVKTAYFIWFCNLPKWAANRLLRLSLILGLRLSLILGLRLSLILGLRLSLILGLRLSLILGLRLSLILGLRLSLILGLRLSLILGLRLSLTQYTVFMGIMTIYSKFSSYSTSTTMIQRTQARFSFIYFDSR